MGAPGPGEARVRHEAIGVNYVDTYHRSGLYPLPLPTGLGVEAAGVVEAVGAGVTLVRPGDRVAYMAGPGAYAEARLLPADRLVKVPDGVIERAGRGGPGQGVHRAHAGHPRPPGEGRRAGGGDGGGRRRGAAAGAVAGVDRRAGHRRGRVGREGGRWCGRWGPSWCWSPAPTTCRRASRPTGRRRAGGLRLGGGRQLRDLPRLPGALRPHGHLRQRLRAGAARRHRAALAQGLAGRLPPHRVPPHRRRADLERAAAAVFACWRPGRSRWRWAAAGRWPRRPRPTGRSSRVPPPGRCCSCRRAAGRRAEAARRRPRLSGRRCRC